MNNNRKKGGRPKKAATEKLKYTLPHVRLSTVDYFMVKAKAKEAGVSLTEYQRQCLLYGYVMERINTEHLQLYRQLAGIGNNQNQLAHQANTYGYEIYHDNAHQVQQLIRKIFNDSENNQR